MSHYENLRETKYLNIDITMYEKKIHKLQTKCQQKDEEIKTLQEKLIKLQEVMLAGQLDLIEKKVKEFMIKEIGDLKEDMQEVVASVDRKLKESK